MEPLSPKNLQLYIISGAGVEPQFKDIYNEVYKTWKIVWSQAFKELDGADTIYSDGFTRHNKIAALMRENVCVALVALRECDMELHANKEDSLLSAWDDESFEKLLVQGSKVGISTYLSVHPDYRGEVAPHIHLKNLIALLMTRLFLDSDCDVMTGTMRKNRGTHKTAYQCGATFIKASSMHDVDVDLVGFFKEEIKASGDLDRDIWVKILWKQRIDLTLPGEQTTQNNKKIKIA